MRARTLALILMLVAAGTAMARDHLVYRCRDIGSGHLSFQSRPCGSGQVQDRIYDATPDQVSPAQEAENLRRNVAPPGPVRSRSASRRSGSAAARGALIGDSAKCRQLRAARDKAYREDHKMGYRERQRWGDQVRLACK